MKDDKEKILCELLNQLEFDVILIDGGLSRGSHITIDIVKRLEEEERISKNFILMEDSLLA